MLGKREQKRWKKRPEEPQRRDPSPRTDINSLQASISFRFIRKFQTPNLETRGFPLDSDIMLNTFNSQDRLLNKSPLLLETTTSISSHVFFASAPKSLYTVHASFF